MKKRKNQSGIAVLLFVFIISIIILMLTMGIQARIDNALKLRARSKSLNDVQLAIDQFSVNLKRAYDLATAAPFSYGVAPLAATGEILLNPAAVTSKVEFFQPASSLLAIDSESGIGNDVNEFCVNRSDMNNFSFDGSARVIAPICIKIPDDFFVKNNPTLDIHMPMEVSKKFETADASKYDFFKIKKAHAQAIVESIHDPGDLSLTSYLGVTQSGTDPASAAMKRQYFGDLNCKATNLDAAAKFFCINIRICPKMINNCDPEEYVLQTFVFLKTPSEIF